MNRYLSKLLSVYKKIFPEYNLSQIGKIGKCCKIGPHSQLILPNLYLDDYVILQDHINFISNKGRLYVGKFSVISAGCIIIPGQHHLKVGMPFFVNAQYHVCDEEHDIIIAEDCWIGAGCILLPGVKIGRGAIVGAGSVVTKDISPYSVVAGCPAKTIAMRMSEKDVIIHEKNIYPMQERFSEDFIHDIYLDKSVNRILADGIYTSNEHDSLRQILKSIIDK